MYLKWTCIVIDHSGAMENWGLLTFCTDILLVDEESSTQEKFHIALIIAHEIAHMWLGDLVTMVCYKILSAVYLLASHSTIHVHLLKSIKRLRTTMLAVLTFHYRNGGQIYGWKRDWLHSWTICFLLIISMNSAYGFTLLIMLWLTDSV